MALLASEKFLEEVRQETSFHYTALRNNMEDNNVSANQTAVKVKGKLNPITCYERPEGKMRYSSTLSLTSSLDGGGWSTPRSGRCTHGKRPDTHCKGCWVGPRVGLDGCGKFRSHRDSIRGPSNLTYSAGDNGHKTQLIVSSTGG